MRAATRSLLLLAASALATVATAEVLSEWRTLTAAHGLPDDRILALHVAGETTWVGTENGLARIDGSTVTAWGREDGLPHAVISAIDFDPQTDTLWLGTIGGGLIRFSAGRFDTLHQRNSGLAGDFVFDVDADAAGVWAATNGGLSRYELYEDRWRLELERRADEPEPVVRTLDRYAGGLLAVRWLEGLTSVDLVPTRDADHSPPPALPTASIPLLGSAAGGVLRVVTTTSLLRASPDGVWSRNRIPGELPGAGSIRCVAADGGAGVWIGTQDGARVLIDAENDTWVVYRADAATTYRDGSKLATRALAPGLPDDRVRAIAIGGGRVWVGTAAGLAVHGLGAGATPGAVGESTARPAREAAPLEISLFDSVSRSIRLAWDRAEPQPVVPKGDLQAARLAVRHAAARNDSEHPLVLVNRPSEFSVYGWGQPEDLFVGHAYDRRVIGSVGYVPPARRISIAVALLAEVPLVNIAPEPRSDAERANPWVFRCPIHAPDRHARAIDHLLDDLHAARLAVVRTGGPLEALHLDGWADHAAARDRPPVVNLEWDTENPATLATLMRELRAQRVDGVLSWTGLERSAELLLALRRAGVDAAFVGSDLMVRDELFELVGDRPGVVVAPRPCPHRLDVESRRRWIAESWRAPSAVSMLTYDAVSHLSDAVLRAGNDRDAVRDELERTERGGVVVVDGGRWRSTQDR